MTTRARVGIVQASFDFAMREINALELRIVTHEDEADAMLWDQAGQVVAQLEAGQSQRAVAAEWINVRTGEPYSQMHVSYVRQTFEKHAFQTPRPRWREAYNEIAHAADGVAHVSHNSGNNEWYTPEAYIEAARAVLGAIDLDPASTPEANAVVRAGRFYSRDDDGLAQPWAGRVWLNPPYAHPLIAHFADKLVATVTAGEVSAAVVLVNNATDTEWFRTLAGVAAAVCFPEGRVHFWTPERESAQPLQGQAVLYAGPDRQMFCETFRAFGTVLVKA